MSLARYADPATIIATSLELGQKGRLMTTAPDGDTMDRMAGLLRSGLTRGIHPQWTLRHERGVTFSQDQLSEIADQVSEGFTSGDAPRSWRLAVYE